MHEMMYFAWQTYDIVGSLLKHYVVIDEMSIRGSMNRCNRGAYDSSLVIRRGDNFFKLLTINTKI